MSYYTRSPDTADFLPSQTSGMWPVCFHDVISQHRIVIYPETTKIEAPQSPGCHSGSQLCLNEALLETAEPPIRHHACTTCSVGGR